MTNAQWAVSKALELNEVEDVGDFYAAGGNEVDAKTMEMNVESVAHDLFGLVQRVDRQVTSA